MNGWDTKEESPGERQAYYRRRLIRAMRGWLYEHARPRFFTMCALVISLAIGNVIAASLPFHGFWKPALWAFVGVFSAWPFFMLLLYGQMLYAFQGFAADTEIEPLLATDRLEEQNDFQEGILDEPADKSRWLTWADEGPGCALVILYAAFSGLGTMLVDLVRQSPTLLSELYLDACLVQRSPELFAAVKREDWLSNLVFGTVFQFFVSALTIAVLAMLITWFIVDPQSRGLFWSPRYHHYGW